MALIVSDAKIRRILSSYKNIVVVGASSKSYRASNSVSRFMMDKGFNIVPVNPFYDELFGKKCYDSLLEVPPPVEIVNIFRRSEDVLSVVEDVLKTDAKVIWMQLGIINEQAAKLATNAGLDVIMDMCIKVEYNRLF